jgi:hypothetical protein
LVPFKSQYRYGNMRGRELEGVWVVGMQLGMRIADSWGRKERLTVAGCPEKAYLVP